MAKLTIWKYKPTVIAITGSAGKTSAKEAIYAVLKNFKRVRKSSANFNNELGVPLTIISDAQEIKKPAILFWLKIILSALVRIISPRKSANQYPEILILEYGADKAGDIEKLVKIAKPTIGIITAIGDIPVHVGNYSSIEAVVREKANLISDSFTGGLSVINGDDPWLSNLKKRTRSQIKTFGTSPDCDIRISHFSHIISHDSVSHAINDHYNYNDRSKCNGEEKCGKIAGITFKLEKEGKSVPVDIADVFSISHAYASACSAVVAEYFGINFISVSDFISKNYMPVSGRSTILDGIKNTQIIDESYNSSPLALKTALETLKMVSGRRKVAILGDMTELGDHTQKAHEMIGEMITSCVDVLITVGEKAKFIASKAIKSGLDKDNLFLFDSTSDALEKITPLIQEGDLILVKGSHSVGLERVVNKLTNF